MSGLVLIARYSNDPMISKYGKIFHYAYDADNSDNSYSFSSLSKVSCGSGTCLGLTNNGANCFLYFSARFSV